MLSFLIIVALAASLGRTDENACATTALRRVCTDAGLKLPTTRSKELLLEKDVNMVG
jgi:hypothetical protein